MKLALFAGLVLVAGSALADTAYVGATLIDGTGGEAIQDGTLIVSGDGLTYVGPTAAAPLATVSEQIDVSGKFITPGFIDTHIHFMESSRIHMDKSVQALDSSLTEADDIAWMKERLGYTLERYVCSGVTTVVSLGGPVHIEMAGRATAMQMERAPRVLLAGGPISNSGLEWIFDGKPAVFAADTEDDMRALVRDFHEKGYDAIKLGFLGAEMGVDTEFTPVDYVPVLKAAADEAHGFGMPVLTHVMTAEAFEAVADSGLDAFAHITFDVPISAAAVDKVVEKRIKVAPTIAVFPKMIEVYDRSLELSDIEKACGDPQVFATYFDYPEESWQNALRFQMLSGFYSLMIGGAQEAIEDSVRRLYAAGAEFIIGSDAAHVGTPHGVALHIEMQMLENAGLPPATLIKAATHNAAEALGKLDEFGTLSTGKSADFLVLEKDPLETIRNAQYIETVVVAGRAIPHALLHVAEEDR